MFATLASPQGRLVELDYKLPRSWRAIKAQKNGPLIALYVVLCYALIIPSILRVLLSFDVQPDAGETIGLDGKVLKGLYQLENDNLN